MNIAAQLLPVPGQYPSIGRDYKYKRVGTVTLMAIDLHTGIIISLVKDNIAVAHVHRLSAWPKKGLNGKQKTGYSSGCLSSLTPNYSPFANYQNGFLHARKVGSKTVVRNIAIEKEILF